MTGFNLPNYEPSRAPVSSSPTPEELIQGGAKKERLVLIFRLYTQDDPEVELNIHRNVGIIRELHPDLKIEYQARKGHFTPRSWTPCPGNWTFPTT